MKRLLGLFFSTMIFFYLLGSTVYAFSIVGVWEGTGTILSNELGGSGNIVNWIIRADGTMNGNWNYTLPDGTAVDWQVTGPYSFSENTLNCTITGEAIFTSPIYPGYFITSDYTLTVEAYATSNTQMNGEYSVIFHDLPMYSNTGTCSGSKRISMPGIPTLLLNK